MDQRVVKKQRAAGQNKWAVITMEPLRICTVENVTHTQTFAWQWLLQLTGTAADFVLHSTKDFIRNNGCNLMHPSWSLAPGKVYLPLPLADQGKDSQSQFLPHVHGRLASWSLGCICCLWQPPLGVPHLLVERMVNFTLQGCPFRNLDSSLYDEVRATPMHYICV